MSHTKTHIQKRTYTYYSILSKYNDYPHTIHLATHKTLTYATHTALTHSHTHIFSYLYNTHSQGTHITHTIHLPTYTTHSTHTSHYTLMGHTH